MIVIITIVKTVICFFAGWGFVDFIYTIKRRK